MPFCTQCGNEVSQSAAFCPNCGARQRTPGEAGGAATVDFLENMSPRTASLLCYIPVAGWIPCVVFLAADRFRNDNTVRFHAFQGLYIFVAWLVLASDWGIGGILHVPIGFGRYHFGNLAHLGLIAAWVYMLIQTGQGARVRLPLLGEWAERSLTKST